MNQTQDYFFMKDEMILSRGIWGEGRGDTFLKTAIEALWSDMENNSDWCSLDEGCFNMYHNKVRWLDGQQSAPKGYRNVKSVTRDFIVGLTFYFIGSEQREALLVKPYKRFSWWYRMTSGLYNWSKYIRTRKLVYLHRYERKAIRSIKIHMFTESFRKKLCRLSDERKAQGRKWKWIRKVSNLFGYMGYVKHLAAMKAYAVDSDQVKSALLSLAEIPKWNYALRVMCGDILEYDDLHAIKHYVGRKGYMWTSNELLERDALADTERYQCDKHLLHWLMNQEYGFYWKNM